MTYNPKNNPLISVIAPIYNEENNVSVLAHKLGEVFKKLQIDWELVFAMDPCTDLTEEKILALIEANFPVRMVKFSRRFGKPISLLAGLRHCLGDAVIVIDSDLQDPPELIYTMIDKWREGNMVVIAQRTSRRGENFFYLKCAEIFYWILEKFSEVEIPRNTGDYRLLDKRVVEEICLVKERHGFLRGLTALVGFKTIVIPFERNARFAGKTQIPLMGAISIALDGVVPFSRVPIRVIIGLGLGIFSTGVLSSILWTLYGLAKGFGNNWPLLALSLFVWVFFGITISCIGIVGEYVLRCYEESRDRPLYTVDKILESKELCRKLKETQNNA
ncbi:MAG: glycosyltransferase family 2 protein [Desulfomonilaceae bacterium]